MRHIFLIAFCLITISGFGQKIREHLKVDNRDFETLYEAVIIKKDGDTIVGEMYHFEEELHKVTVFRGRARKKKVKGVDIRHLFIDGELYGAIPIFPHRSMICYSVLDKRGFKVYRTKQQLGGLFLEGYGYTDVSYYNRYYLYLDGKYYKVQDDRYSRKTWNDRIYSIFAQYDYFRSAVKRETAEMMTIENMTVRYLQLRKEHEAKTDKG